MRLFFAAWFLAGVFCHRALKNQAEKIRLETGLLILNPLVLFLSFLQALDVYSLGYYLGRGLAGDYPGECRHAVFGFCLPLLLLLAALVCARRADAARFLLTYCLCIPSLCLYGAAALLLRILKKRMPERLRLPVGSTRAFFRFFYEPKGGLSP